MNRTELFRVASARTLLGVGAVLAFLAALPAAAMACVTPQGCVAAGGTIFNSQGTLICVGGQLAFQEICPNGPSPPSFANKWIPAFIHWGIDNPQQVKNIVDGLNPEALAPEILWDIMGGDKLLTGGESSTQGGSHLGMYSSSSTPGQSGWGGMGGGFSARGSGLGVTDTAGGLAPGTKASVQDSNGNGGIFGVYDATRFLPTNQSLVFSGFFNYANDNITVGPIAGVSLANAASAQSDTYTFGGSVLYRNNMAYLQGTAAYDFGRASETQSVDGSTGSFGTSGYFVDAKLGNIFVLLNTTGVPGPAALPTKAPPKPTGGALVGLDASGHIGYSGSWIDGFTDSSGFVYGTGQTRFGDIGGRVKLFVAIPSNGLLWVPYVAGTIDQLFGFSSTLNIPSQPALAGGDLISLQEAKTFGGAQLGIDARGPGGWTVGIKGFYTASADTSIIGGNAYVKMPLNYTPLAAPRY
jgi:hypothetical protein